MLAQMWRHTYTFTHLCIDIYTSMKAPGSVHPIDPLSMHIAAHIPFSWMMSEAHCSRTDILAKMVTIWKRKW